MKKRVSHKKSCDYIFHLIYRPLKCNIESCAKNNGKIAQVKKKL